MSTCTFECNQQNDNNNVNVCVYCDFMMLVALCLKQVAEDSLFSVFVGSFDFYYDLKWWLARRAFWNGIDPFVSDQDPRHSECGCLIHANIHAETFSLRAMSSQLPFSRCCCCCCFCPLIIPYAWLLFINQLPICQWCCNNFDYV